MAITAHFMSTRHDDPGLRPWFDVPKDENQLFWSALNALAKSIHDDNVAKGFYDDDVTKDPMTKFALMHSEISEAVEAYRKDLKDQHLPQYDGVAVELADALIRILDTMQYMGYNIGEVVKAKLDYNRTRPYKHGKKF